MIHDHDRDTTHGQINTNRSFLECMGSSADVNRVCVIIDCPRKSRGLHLVRAIGHGPVYRSMPAGVAQSRHAFVGGTVSTWGR